MDTICLQTSVNINRDNLLVLEQSAECFGISISDLITMLLRKMLIDNENRFKKLETVKYQPDDPEKNWTIKKVSFKPEDYELFTNMRMFYKLSVSFILAKAIDQFLDDIIENFGKIQNNYLEKLWEICRQECDSSVIWTVNWIKPLFPMKI